MGTNRAFWRDYVNPLEFLLQIGEKRGRSYPVAVLASPSGETPQEAVRFPFGEATLGDRLTQLQVELLRSGMDKLQASSREQMVQDLGRSLFNAIFRGTIRTVFARSRSEATHQGKILRITLRILSAKM